MIGGKRNPERTRQRLVDAAVRLILRQGFAATTVDAMCAEAGLTKGSFFHHFADKEAVGRAAIAWWSAMGTALYAEAWSDPAGDPLEQLRAMLEIMTGFAERPDEPCVCVVGMMAQELAGSHPVIRGDCEDALGVWTGNVARLLAAAKERHKPDADFDPVAVAWFLNSLWQGSMLVAKTCRDPRLIVENLRLAREFVDGLFG